MTYNKIKIITLKNGIVKSCNFFKVSKHLQIYFDFQIPKVSVHLHHIFKIFLCPGIINLVIILSYNFDYNFEL